MCRQTRCVQKERDDNDQSYDDRLLVSSRRCAYDDRSRHEPTATALDRFRRLRVGEIPIGIELFSVDDVNQYITLCSSASSWRCASVHESVAPH